MVSEKKLTNLAMCREKCIFAVFTIEKYNDMNKDNNNPPARAGVTNVSNVTRFKKKAFLETFALNMGNVSEASKAIGITRMTFYRWCDSDSDFRKAVEDVQEGLLDMTEGELLKLIKKGDVTSIIFYLKTKGKRRGYVERTEQDLTLSPADFVEKSIQYERTIRTER